MIPVSYHIRYEKDFPSWRQHSDKEMVILQGLFNSPVSVDKITRFSVRPPELRGIFRKVGCYYQWFIFQNKRIGRIKL